MNLEAHCELVEAIQDLNDALESVGLARKVHGVPPWPGPGDKWVVPSATNIGSFGAGQLRVLTRALMLAVVARSAISELDAVHYPTDYDDGRPQVCATCGAADGAWPCVSRQVADDLRASIGGES